MIPYTPPTDKISRLELKIFFKANREESQRLLLFLKGHPRPLMILFLVFVNQWYNFVNKRENIPLLFDAGIWTNDLFGMCIIL